jgi:hypothetical protein
MGMNKEILTNEIEVLNGEIAYIKDVMFEANITIAMMCELSRKKMVLLESRKEDLRKLAPINAN